MTINIDRKVTQMLWAPLESLDNSKRHQFCYTDNNGNTHFFGYHTNNGTNIRRLIEHAFNYPAAAQNLPLTDHQKAVFFSQTLLPPATGVFQQELSKQVAAAGDPANVTLEELLQAHVAKRLADHGQKAAYRQLEGLKSVRKLQSIKVFEWDSLFFIGNDVASWIPGPEDKMDDTTLLRAFLDTFPDKWISDFENTKTNDMVNTNRSVITSHMMEKESASALAQRENQNR